MRCCLFALLLISCSQKPGPLLFAGDVAFLAGHTDVRILEAGTGQVAVCPELQGRVMTSTLGDHEPGLGFIGRRFIQNPNSEERFHNHGGEERFWVGPESGPFSFFFQPGEVHSRDLWKVPKDLDKGVFDVLAGGDDFLLLERQVELTNLLGFPFLMHVTREIKAPTLNEIEEVFGLLPTGAAWTGFSTATEVRNVGLSAWEKEMGLPCIWMAGMFRPGPETFAILPFGAGNGLPVYRDYFETVPDNRFALGDGFAVFKTDAMREGKIGILRDRAVPRMGAFNPDSGILTLVSFGPIEPLAPYMAQHWGLDIPNPFHGDVVNSYNSGGDPFFELESSSPGLELKPGESWTHRSTTIHLRLSNAKEISSFASQALQVNWEAVLAARPWVQG